MQLKTSYFNGTLFRKNLMRFWPLWGGASLAGALAPLAMLMEIVRYGPKSIPTPEITAAFYSVLAWAVPVVSLIYAVLCALAVWHYLYNARSVSMYHSLPVRREGLFVTNFLSGMAMMLIPYVAVGLLTVITSIAGGFLDLPGLAITALGVAGLSFFYFSTATAVAFITGNPFALAGLYFIFHFLAAALEFLLSTIMAGFYYGVDVAYGGVVEWLSPTIFLVTHLRATTSSHYETFTAANGKVFENRVLDAAHLVNGHLIALYALAGVALVALAWLLYRNRRSESAGDVIAVGWMKPVFRYGVSVCTALAGGLGLYLLLFDDFFADLTGSNFSFLPMAFCMAFAGLLGFYIASMLLAKSLHVFRSTWKGAVTAAVVAVALCGLAAADPAGMEHWIPEADAVESVYLSEHQGSNGTSCSGEVSEPETLEKLLDLHQTILAEHDAFPGERAGIADSSLSLTYTLKNGRQVSRSYRLVYSLSDVQTEGSALQKLAELVTLPEVQRSNLFYNRTQDDQITSGSIADLYNLETGEYESRQLNHGEARALEAAILRDIDAGRFGKTFFLSQEERRDTVYVNNFYLDYAFDRIYEPTQGVQRDYYSTSFSISRYCTETLQALADLGVINETQRLLTEAEQNALYQAESPAEDSSFNGETYYHDPYTGDLYPATEEAF
ncbi:MAG: hypothetical protein HFF85_02690 [Oscillibacter sp.]|nr:hypothetical protein [Oscillibacter sp.]MCI9375293.1 hypothetical protein [Oscillibacter sp.]